MSDTLLARIEKFAAGVRTALLEGSRTFTYADLDAASRRVAAALLDGTDDLNGDRVAFLVPPGLDYVAVLLGIWRAGGIAVPLAVAHSPAELRFVIEDCGASTMISTAEFASRLPAAGEATGLRVLCVSDGCLHDRDGRRRDFLRPSASGLRPEQSNDRRAMILYTSGTTGRPKGVVTTHAKIAAQIESLIAAWEWRQEDRTLLVLPLHHVHGIINVIGCALWSGAVCEIHPRFDPEAAWARLSSGEITVFTAVPTIYYRLVASWDAASDGVRRQRSDGAGFTRLMMSGSAALPVRILERWREITGHVLLERYGMTEIGMALANPLHGKRQPGRVGVPLPGVDVRLVGEDGRAVRPGVPGELEVRGPAVFDEYWQQPEATREAFHDGWFRTGDVAIVEHDTYRLLGRTSIDIIKSAGHKISALEIEDALRDHPAIAECAVVGVDDEEWGQRVCAAVELRSPGPLTLAELEPWARERLAPYKIPRTLIAVDALPRNAMGKVVKPDVARLFEK